MRDMMVRKVWITIISCLMTITCKCEERRCLVNETISIKYTIDPFDNEVRWKRDGLRIQDATMNATNNGCKPNIFGQAVGYEFGCKTINNASEYTLTFKCRPDDNGIIYTLSNTPIKREFTYTPVTSSEGLTTCKNDTALSGECEVHCNTAQSMISWTYVGENKETISVYNSSSVSCNDAVTNLYKLTVDIDGLKDKVSGPANLTGILTIGGEQFYLTTIINGSSSGGGCDLCIPVLVPIGVVVCVVIVGAAVKYKMAKDKEKKSDRQDEATELKDPKIQQREGEIEKQENH